MTIMARSLAADRQAGHRRNCRSSWELAYLRAPGKERASHERKVTFLKARWGGLASAPDLNLQCYLKESVSNNSDILICVYGTVPENSTNETPNSRIFFTISVNIKWTTHSAHLSYSQSGFQFNLSSELTVPGNLFFWASIQICSTFFLTTHWFILLPL